jgi:hypothetical protein
MDTMLSRVKLRIVRAQRLLFGFSYNENLRLKLLGKEDNQTKVESGVVYSYPKRGLDLTVLRGNLLDVSFVPVIAPK